MAWHCISPEVTARGFNKCCILSATDETDGDMLWNGNEEDGNVRSECEGDEGTDCRQWRTQEFFSGGGSTNSVEDRGQRERGTGGGSPLVRGSGGSCNLVQEISLHIVKFSQFLVL